MNILAHYRCPCIGCEERPGLLGPLCWWHESMLRGTAHRRYIGACSLFTCKPSVQNLSRCAAVLAGLLTTIALKEGLIGTKQAEAVSRRYDKVEYVTSRRNFE